MSNSIHTSRAKFRKAYRFRYGSEKERIRILGKILDEVSLKRALKRNTKARRKALKRSLPVEPKYVESKIVLAKRTMPSEDATQMVARHVKRGYGRVVR